MADITYCNAHICPLKLKCERYPHNDFNDGKLTTQFWVDNFYKPDVKCEYYLKIKN